MNRKGLSLVEMLFVILLFGLVSASIYRFLTQYSKGYLKVTDKMENVAEGWHILRLLNDDLLCSTFSENEIASTAATNMFTNGVFQVVRRRGKITSPVSYRFDPGTGSITREENGQKKTFLNTRCKQFKIETCFKPSTSLKKQNHLFFRIKIDIGETKEKLDSAKPISLETCIFPVFANLQLHKQYVHEGFPDLSSAQ